MNAAPELRVTISTAGNNDYILVRSPDEQGIQILLFADRITVNDYRKKDQ